MKINERLALQKAVDIDSNRKEIWTLLASALDDNKEYKESISAYEKALENDSSDFDLWVGIAMAYANDGNFTQAIKAFEKALKINSKIPAVWFRLGNAFSNIGKLNKAIDAIKMGLDLDPTIVQAWMDLHEVYKKKGDIEKAGWAFRQAMGTGKIDVQFARDEQEVLSQIKEWENTHKEKDSKADADFPNDLNIQKIMEGTDTVSAKERRLFSSWVREVPLNYEEHPEGNGIQLNSPDGERSITASALGFEGSVPSDMVSSLVKNYEQARLKLFSKIKKNNLQGHVFENIMFLHKGVLLIQCIIVAPSRLLMLTFSIRNTKENKEWALRVINSVKLYQD